MGLGVAVEAERPIHFTVTSQEGVSMSFLQYFHKNVTKIKLVEKKKSSFMRFLNFCLTITNTLKITNIVDFLGAYGTTIGHTVYESPVWKWEREPLPHMVHELTHVLEWSLWYALEFLFSSRRRAYYESVCIQSEWMIFPQHMTAYNIENRARKLVGYGIDHHTALRILRERANEINNGNPRKESRRMKEVYEAWKHEQAGLQ